MIAEQRVSQRDLRLRSREIMDAVERGEEFTVTRDGRGIGQLVPLPRKRVFLSRAEFVALGRGLPQVDAEAFRADLDAAADQFPRDPFAG
jgi:antitoxin (DNA-binding transcriptional repressor) of toxin-antitoxin stability system